MARRSVRTPYSPSEATDEDSIESLELSRVGQPNLHWRFSPHRLRGRSIRLFGRCRWKIRCHCGGKRRDCKVGGHFGHGKRHGRQWTRPDRGEMDSVVPSPSATRFGSLVDSDAKTVEWLTLDPAKDLTSQRFGMENVPCRHQVTETWGVGVTAVGPWLIVLGGEDSQSEPRIISGSL